MPENETVSFKNDSQYLGEIGYIGLHGEPDVLHLKPGETGEVGLGAGHYGEDGELALFPPVGGYR